jgi:uncharacterized protein (DUF1810 family)
LPENIQGVHFPDRINHLQAVTTSRAQLLGEPLMFDLERFVTAQEPVYEDVLAELRAGRKRTHWMWYIFPQLCGLGRSAMAERFGIVSAEEARAYLAHPLLGKRLVRSVETVLAVPDRSLQEIFRSPDDMKFRSSMTLFAVVDREAHIFQTALQQYCSGVEDPATLSLLRFDDRGAST